MTFLSFRDQAEIEHRGPHLFLFFLLLVALPARIDVVAQVPLNFTLSEAGYVTIVIDSTDGSRIRNVIQNTYFGAGDHSIDWDGFDEGYGVNYDDRYYEIQRRLVSPGTYHVKALFHKGIDLLYEFSVQSPGTPAWLTEDHSGAWFSDHAPPLDALFIPAGRHGPDPVIQFTAKTNESGHGLIYLYEDGTKQVGIARIKNIGLRVYEASARDDGPLADPEYVSWHAMLRNGNSIRLLYQNAADTDTKSHQTTIVTTAIHGIVAYDNVVAVSYPGGLYFVDATDGKTNAYVAINTLSVPGIQGISTNGTQLFAVVGTSLIRYDVDFAIGVLANPAILATGLDQPKRLRLIDGSLFVSEHGASHRIKVFDLAGTLLQTIGKPGGPQVGLYDEERMSHPMGFDVDSQGKLWVAENAYMPKRISRWNTATGAFEKAFYGPAKYGGGLVIDSLDSRRAYYAGHAKGVIEFDLNWVTGENKPKRVLHNRERSGLIPPNTKKGPDAPARMHVVNNERYFVTSGWSQNNGTIYGEQGVWRERADTLAWVVQIGKTKDWQNVFSDQVRYPAIAAHVSASFPDSDQTLFIWSDLDNNGDVSLDELAFRDLGVGLWRVYFDRNLNIHVSDGSFLPLTAFSADGVPVYDFADFQPGGYVETGLGGQIVFGDNTLITTHGPLDGYRDGKRLWRYHAQWPRRQPGAPIASYEGQLIQTTRILNEPWFPTAGESGSVWMLNSDEGEIYLFTTDGYFVATLLGDFRTMPFWRYPAGVINRGDPIGRVSTINEHFWPFLSKGDDGNLYLTAGKGHTSILRVSGLEHSRRLDLGTVDVTAEMTGRSAEIHVLLEGAYDAAGVMRTSLADSGILPLAQPFSAPAFDGTPIEYDGTESIPSLPSSSIVDWVLIELRTGTDPASRVATRPALLRADGLIVDIEADGPVNFPGLSGDAYYVVVRHRNHLAIMSAAPVDFTSGTGVLNFTNAAGTAFGGQAMAALHDGLYGLPSGDGNAGGQIQNDDVNITWAIQVGTSGYKGADYDLNGEVQNSDANVLWAKNVGRGSQVPE